MDETLNKLEIIKKAISDKIGYDIEVIDIREKANFADYFVICSATNSSQLSAICDNVEYEMGKAGYEAINPSKNRSNDWILLDYDEIIVHIFDIKARKFYDIERLWKERDINKD